MFRRQRNYKFLKIEAVLIIASASCAAFGQTPAKNDACETLPAHPSEREMTDAQTHCYQFDLRKDDYSQIRVEQKGVDVALKLFDAKGKLLANIDSPNGMHGFENLFFIADEAGVYKLKVISLSANAANGAYVVFRESSRPATEKDRRQVEAETAIGQAKNSSLPQEALAGYRKASELFRANGDHHGEARTFVEAGIVSHKIGDRSSALTFFEKALPLFKAASDEREVAKTLKEIGAVYFVSGENKKAIEYFEKALPLFKADDALEKADSLQSIGNVYLRLTELPKALEYYSQAAPLFRAANNSSGEVDTLSNSGLVYLELGQKQKALDIFTQALSIIRKNGIKQSEVAVLNNIGRANDDLGNKEKALEHFNLALSITGKKQEKAAILLSIGKIHYDAGDKQKALEHFEQSLQMFRAVGDRFGEITAANAVGRAYSGLGDKRKAIEYYSLALRLYKNFGHKRGEAFTLNNLMFVAASLGNRPLAIFYGKQSINVFQQLRASIQKLGKEAQRSFVKSVETAYRGLAGFLIEEGRVLEAQEVLALLKEEEFYQFTQRSPDSASGSIRPIGLNAKESEAAQIYRDLTDKIAAATRRFSELETERRAQPLAPEKQAEAQKLQTELTALNERFANLLQELSVKFGEPKPPAGAVETPTLQTNAWHKKLAELGGDAVLLTTLLTENRYYIIMTTANAQTVRSVEISPADLNEKIIKLREILEEPRSDALPATRELYQILVKPIEADLARTNAKTLLWSLDGALRYVPLAALHDGRGFLVEKYASVLVTLAQPPELDRAVPENWRALGAGVSAAIENLPPLPQVPVELKSIVKDENAANPRTEKGIFVGKRLLDREFSRANFGDALRQKNQLVHLATHFVFRPGKDADSFLLLGDGDRLNLADWQTSDLFDLSGVELLTLSACETALGAADASGAEIESFGVIAQRRGAKTVLASLWSIADSSTAQLMTEFYRQYQKGKETISKAEALRRAQLTLLKKRRTSRNYQHPAYWGAFIVVGDL